MPEKHGKRSVTCADCYFRQELLCALDRNDVCPTFRATVGRAPASPRQAQLMQVVGMPAPGGLAPAARQAPSPEQTMSIAAPVVHADRPETVTGADVALAPMPVAEHEAAGTTVPLPFAVSAPEATFTVRQAIREAGLEAASDHAARAAAAAAAPVGQSCVIELPDQPTLTEGVDALSGAAGAGASTWPGSQDRSDRAGRVARRVAERYPRARQIS